MTILTFPATEPSTAVGVRPTVVDALAFGAAVFMILIYSQAWVFPLMGSGPADASTSTLIRSLFYPAYAAALGVLLLGAGSVGRALVRSPLLVILLLLVAASVTWSIAPDVTARRWIALAFTTLSGLVIGARLSWRALAEAFAVSHAVLVSASLIVCVALPSVGVMSELFPGAWRGLWSEKNMLGANMALAVSVFTAAAILRPSRRGLWLGFATLALLLVVMSTSKTALLATVLGLACTVFVGLARRGPAAGVSTTWLAGVGVVILGLGVLVASDAVFELLGKDATLTGRTEIWEAALRQVQTRPWTGFGYGAIWDNPSNWGPARWIERDAGYSAVHAHNGWLEVWLGFGLVGVAVWGLYLLETWVRTVFAVYADDGADTGGYLALPTLAMFTLMTLTESVVINYNDLRWVMFVAVAVKLAAPHAWRRT